MLCGFGVCAELIKWGLESLAPYSNWFHGETKNPKESKLSESALPLLIHDKETPDLCQKVANMIPGKVLMDVSNQTKELVNDVSDIEAGLSPSPGNEELKQSYGSGMKRTASDHERKKGVPWTEEEHKLFLLGLKTYGKGDWRNISRNFVITRTPTQVASHAQKYFIRQCSGGKEWRKPSIHNITTSNLLGCYYITRQQQSAFPG